VRPPLADGLILCAERDAKKNALSRVGTSEATSEAKYIDGIAEVKLVAKSEMPGKKLSA